MSDGIQMGRLWDAGVDEGALVREWLGSEAAR